MKTFDAIVIGAGVAGLAAARDLSGSRHRICVIEARDRVGGRVMTEHVSGIPVPIELGAEFIHVKVAETFSIVDGAAILVYAIPDDHCWSAGGRPAIRDYWSDIQRLRARIKPIARGDRSFAAYLRSKRLLSTRARQMALAFVEGYHAAHADRISALSLQTSDEETQDPCGNRQFRAGGGYDAVVDWLRAGCDPDRTQFRLGTVVTAVRWSDGDGHRLLPPARLTARGTHKGPCRDRDDSDRSVEGRGRPRRLGAFRAPTRRQGARTLAPRTRPRREDRFPFPRAVLGRPALCGAASQR